MSRPGVEVISRALPLPRSAPTDTGVAFLVGKTASGGAVSLVRSLTEYEATYGIRTGGVDAYDAADTYFREGGARLVVSPTNPSAARSSSGGKASKASGDAEPTPAAVDPTIQAALDALSTDWGPGQVFVADTVLGPTPDTQAALLAHAAAHNRIALLSTPDGTASVIEAAATALRSNVNARYGALFAPHVVVPGVSVGTTRTVTYAAAQAGLISRLDGAGQNANQPAAGVVNGSTSFALDLTERYTDAEYESMNDAGANLARIIYGNVATYGYRTLVDPQGVDWQWLSLGNARLNMQIVALAEQVGQRYVFTQIDGRRRIISQFGGDLSAMLVPLYTAGALYGETPDDAFYVDVGTAVNTEQTIAAGELHAVIECRMSPFAEYVQIEIVKVATTQTLAPTVAAAA